MGNIGRTIREVEKIDEDEPGTIIEQPVQPAEPAAVPERKKEEVPA